MVYRQSPDHKVLYERGRMISEPQKGVYLDRGMWIWKAVSREGGALLVRTCGGVSAQHSARMPPPVVELLLRQ